MVRHGWQEYGKTRRVGEHGTQHDLPCFGSGRAPYETSTETTMAFIEQRLLPLKATYLAQMERLNAKPGPGLPFRFSQEISYENRDNEYVTKTVIVNPGDKELVVPALVYQARDSKVPSYQTLVAATRAELRSDLRNVDSNIAFCEKKIATWSSK